MILLWALGLLLAARPGQPAVPQVRVGLERIADGEGAALRSRRIGLLCHAASVTHDGRHALEILRSSGAEVVRLFAPEHGWRGHAAAGAAVSDGSDADSGLQVLALYGPRTRPAPGQLADLDALVVDLQDAGVRFYTYAGTLLESLEACAEAGVELIVLDRPNPLGGERLEGPELDAAASRSPLARTPGPLIHGLTLGEIALHANAALTKPARVTVVPMAGWRREMTWNETGRDWIAPSPNLRTAEAALAYPGTALLEATNVSEGRGSESPFLLLGAPWLGAAVLAEMVSVPGFVLEAARFRPQSSPAAPRPKYEGVDCAGVRVSVVDAREAAPYRLGVALLAALRQRPEFRWRDGGRALDRLVGNARLRKALERGRRPDDILASDVPGCERFRRARRAGLLY